jgi:N-acetylglucosaminyldiphosphoundecaprenol N-acetyl-beta-D-mannosaminyltransferase
MADIVNPSKRTRLVAGIPISTDSNTEIVKYLIQRAKLSKQGFDVHLVNAFTVASAVEDPSYLKLLKSSGMNIADGKPMQWATAFSKNPLKQFRGPDLFRQLLSSGIDHGLTHFFLGSTEDTLDKLTKKIELTMSGVKIAGRYSPEFGPRSEQDIHSQKKSLLEANPDVIWVGLGTPKQDFEARELLDGNNSVIIAIGAAFDFFAGTKKEAPALWRVIGLEWFFRLVQEPGRLWKRYIFGNLKFIYALIAKRS